MFLLSQNQQSLKSAQHGVWDIQEAGLVGGKIKAGSASRINA
jgi:hypothetical protein